MRAPGEPDPFRPPLAGAADLVSRSGMPHLPDDVLAHILSALADGAGACITASAHDGRPVLQVSDGPRHLARCEGVCAEWKAMVRGAAMDGAWRRMCQADFPWSDGAMAAPWRTAYLRVRRAVCHSRASEATLSGVDVLADCLRGPRASGERLRLFATVRQWDKEARSLVAVSSRCLGDLSSAILDAENGLYQLQESDIHDMRNRRAFPPAEDRRVRLVREASDDYWSLPSPGLSGELCVVRSSDGACALLGRFDQAVPEEGDSVWLENMATTSDDYSAPHFCQPIVSDIRIGSAVWWLSVCVEVQFPTPRRTRQAGRRRSRVMGWVAGVDLMLALGKNDHDDLPCRSTRDALLDALHHTLQWT